MAKDSKARIARPRIGVVLLAAKPDRVAGQATVLRKWARRLRRCTSSVKLIVAVPADSATAAWRRTVTAAGWIFYSGSAGQLPRLRETAKTYRLSAIVRLTPDNLLVPTPLLTRLLAVFSANPHRAVTTAGYPSGIAATIFPAALLEQMIAARNPPAHPVQALQQGTWRRHRTVLVARKSITHRLFSAWRGRGRVVSYDEAEQAPGVDLRPGAPGTSRWCDGSEPPAVAAMLRAAIVARAKIAAGICPGSVANRRAPRRILLADHTAIGGGAEHSMLETAIGLRERGWQVHAAFLTPGLIAQACARQGTTTTIIPGRAAGPLARQLHCAALLEELPGAIICVNSAYTLESFLAPALARRHPVVAHIREFLDPATIDATGLGACTAVIANSAATATHLRGYLPAGKLHVVHNGLDPDKVRAMARRGEQLDRHGHALVIGICGRLSPYKGFHTALRALAIIRARGLDAALAVIGSGFGFPGEAAYEQYLRQLSSQLRLGDAVLRYPYRDNPFGLLAGIDLLVVPTEGEPFGRVILEALALGKPVIATSDGGPAEILGRRGLVEPAAAGKLAAAIIARLSSPGKPPAFPSRFTRSAYLDRLEAVLHSVRHQTA